MIKAWRDAISTLSLSMNNQSFVVLERNYFITKKKYHHYYEYADGASQ